MSKQEITVCDFCCDAREDDNELWPGGESYSGERLDFCSFECLAAYSKMESIKDTLPPGVAPHLLLPLEPQ